MKGIEHILVASTALERLKGLRQLDTRRVYDFDYTLLAEILLGVLVVLLIYVSYARRKQRSTATREVFAENAMRRGLGTRDRQILLAIVMRSGLRRTQDVFTAVDAFDRGAIKLLSECVRTRTPQENEQLRSEIGRLREKLGFQIASPIGGAVGLGQASSRDIPIGRSLEFVRNGRADELVVRGEVVRNDEIEFAVKLPAPIVSRAGESWHARYYSGLSAWEFDTSTVRCDGTRLTLNHSESVQSTNRRRFPRVAVRGHALVAYLPFRQGRASRSDATVDINTNVSWSAAIPAASEAPVFVEGRVTEVAGPGLLIESSIQLHPGDRVLVVFTLDPSTAPAIPGGWGTITGIGRVRHCRGMEPATMIAIEFTGLSDAEIDELAYITAEISSREDGPADRHAEQNLVASASAQDAAQEPV
ncbi:MAG: hypothetical protein ACM3VT_07610 [Solirubrobacterales bacterium]